MNQSKQSDPRTQAKWRAAGALARAKPYSFAELEEDQNVTAAQVANALEEYVSVGAAITGRVVIGLIRRTSPNDKQRRRMQQSAAQGRSDQTRRGFPREAAHFGRVHAHLAQ